MLTERQRTIETRGNFQGLQCRMTDATARRQPQIEVSRGFGRHRPTDLWISPQASGPARVRNDRVRPQTECPLTPIHVLGRAPTQTEPLLGPAAGRPSQSGSQIG
jgi:hypothetical protein